MIASVEVTDITKDAMAQIKSACHVLVYPENTDQGIIQGWCETAGPGDHLHKDESVPFPMVRIYEVDKDKVVSVHITDIDNGKISKFGFHSYVYAGRIDGVSHPFMLVPGDSKPPTMVVLHYSHECEFCVEFKERWNDVLEDNRSNIDFLAVCGGVDGMVYPDKFNSIFPVDRSVPFIYRVDIVDKLAYYSILPAANRYHFSEFVTRPFAKRDFADEEAELKSETLAKYMRAKSASDALTNAEYAYNATHNPN